MIVFDSSTLTLLAKVGLLDDFIDDYGGKILIPRSVEVESCRQKESFEVLLLRRRVRENKIGVVRISKLSLCTRLIQDFCISRGEAEAIVLALEKKARLVATDDRNAIKACKVLKIHFASAITILIRMKNKGVIDKERAGTALEALIKYGRYSEAIISEAKVRLEKL